MSNTTRKLPLQFRCFGEAVYETLRQDYADNGGDIEGYNGGPGWGTWDMIPAEERVAYEKAGNAAVVLFLYAAINGELNVSTEAAESEEDLSDDPHNSSDSSS